MAEPTRAKPNLSSSAIGNPSETNGCCVATLHVACCLLPVAASLAYAELGTLVPRSGGEYVYYRAAFGSTSFWGQLPSFTYVWVSVMVMRSSSQAILSLSLGEYAAAWVSQAGQLCLQADTTYYLVRIVAAVCMCEWRVMNGSVCFGECRCTSAPWPRFL